MIYTTKHYTSVVLLSDTVVNELTEHLIASASFLNDLNWEIWGLEIGEGLVTLTHTSGKTTQALFHDVFCEAMVYKA